MVSKMQDQKVTSDEDVNKPKGSSGSKPPRKISGSHMPASRRNICYLFPVSEDGDSSPVDVK